MTEPQRLDYSMHRQSTKPAIIIKFNEHTESVTFNVDMVCKYLFLHNIIKVFEYIFYFFLRLLKLLQNHLKHQLIHIIVKNVGK